MTHQPSRSMIDRLTAVGTLLMTSLGLAADPARPSAEAPDWKKLDGLIEAGEYDKAMTLADEIARVIKPDQRKASFTGDTKDKVRALKTKGCAELHVGRLDEAEATLLDAYRTFRDRDFQRLLALELRQSAQSMRSFVEAELSWVALLNLRMGVVLERLRFASLARSAEGDAPEKVEEWLKDLTILERIASEAREALTTRFDKGGDDVLASPSQRALVGEFWPALQAGIRSLHLSRLASDDAASSESETSRNKPRLERRELVEDAMRYFETAEAALDLTVAAATPKGSRALRPAAKTEEALLRAELLTHQGYAMLVAGQPAQAREHLAAAVQFLKQAATQRGLPHPETHPSLFWPNLLMAEIMLEESRLALAGGDAALAKATAGEAAQRLDEAYDSTFPKAHPLRARAAALKSRLSRALAAAEATMPGTEAADAAARNLRRAIDATAASDTAF